MPVLSVLNRKGGAGKTTLATGLAGALSERFDLVVIDADPQGSASRWLGGFDGCRVVHAPEPAELLRVLDSTKADLVIADGPPFDAQRTGALMGRSDLILVPVVPSAVDLDAAAPLLRSIKEGKRGGLVALNMTNPRTTISRDMRAVVKRFGVPVARTEIARRVAHAESSVARLPVTHYQRRSLAAEEIRNLSKEVARRLKGK